MPGIVSEPPPLSARQDGWTPEPSTLLAGKAHAGHCAAPLRAPWALQSRSKAWELWIVWFACAANPYPKLYTPNGDLQGWNLERSPLSLSSKHGGFFIVFWHILTYPIAYVIIQFSLGFFPIAHLLLWSITFCEWPIWIIYNSKYVVQIGHLLLLFGFTTQKEWSPQVPPPR